MVVVVGIESNIDRLVSIIVGSTWLVHSLVKIQIGGRHMKSTATVKEFNPITVEIKFESMDEIIEFMNAMNDDSGVEVYENDVCVEIKDALDCVRVLEVSK